MPEVGGFFKNATRESKGYKRKIKSIIGELRITNSQAQKLEIRQHTQLSPYFIDRRIKISGAQWKIDHVPQVLAHHCAYLNGLIFAR